MHPSSSWRATSLRRLDLNVFPIEALEAVLKLVSWLYVRINDSKNKGVNVSWVLVQLIRGHFRENRISIFSILPSKFLWTPN